MRHPARGNPITQMSLDGISADIGSALPSGRRHERAASRERAKLTTLSGTFYDAGGTCPGRRSVIEGASFDPQTGKVDFVAKDERTGVVVAEFHDRLGERGLVASAHAASRYR